MNQSRREFLKNAATATLMAMMPVGLAKQLVEREADISDDYIVLKHNGYLRITFFGTGLNVLAEPREKSRGADLYLNGLRMPEGASLAPTDPGIIKRLFSKSQTYPICSGLTYGIHTVMLKFWSEIEIQGYEVILPEGVERSAVPVHQERLS